MVHRLEKRALAFGTEGTPALARLELAMLEALMVAAIAAFGAALLF
jgi:hypothetical protein